MTLRLVSWNAERILAKAPKALEQVGPVLGEEAQRQIQAVQYNWPNPTLRFTSLGMGGTPGGRAAGRLSPPTTAAGARNTRQFKAAAADKQGRGLWIKEGPRDIIDTGVLLRSQTPPRVTLTNIGADLTIRWNAPYSGVVLRGGDYGSYVNPVGAIVDVGVKPGRNWIAKTYQAQPVGRLFAEAWQQLRA